MKLLTALLLLTIAAVAQDTTSFALNAGKFKILRVGNLPQGTKFHVQSDLPIHVFLVSRENALNVRTYADLLRGSCHATDSLETTIGCQQKPDLLIVLDRRNVRADTAIALAEGAIAHSGSGAERLLKYATVKIDAIQPKQP